MTPEQARRIAEATERSATEIDRLARSEGRHHWTPKDYRDAERLRLEYLATPQEG